MGSDGTGTADPETWRCAEHPPRGSRAEERMMRRLKRTPSCLASTDPTQAVRAALAMQAGIASSAHTGRDLVLKVGIHAGPSVVVTLNDRLDYFGSTVNLALGSKLLGGMVES